MKIVQINTLPDGSTGKIASQLCDLINRENDCSAFFYCGKWKKVSSDTIHYFGTKFENFFSRILTEITGKQNMFSVFGSQFLIRSLKRIRPDVIHLHNLHLWVMNLPMLFKFIKKNKIKVVWTLHDCWAFTGHCPHFTMVECDKWKTGCYKCPQYRDYPKSIFDNSKKMYRLKKEWFTGVENLTIVTPSEWLAGLVKQSFLKDYPVKVIHNGIDLNVFKPTESDFRKKYNIAENKYILLGVAFGWGKRKGLDVFIELRERLDKDKYQIVLVGTDDNADKQLPKEIISIHRTQNQTELAEIYTVADLFVNPTREENYPTVNMESIACGTPVITFKTGGSPECINEKSGMVVDCDDVDAMQKGIEEICEKHLFSSKDCITQAQSFDMNKRFQEYIDLYKTLA